MDETTMTSLRVPDRPTEAAADGRRAGDSGEFGRHLLVELIHAQHLDDARIINNALRECAAAAGAKLIDLHLHEFADTGGFSGIAILAESHISIHSWPEHGYAALDLFMCGRADPRRALPVLERVFRPEKMIVEEMVRGTARKKATPSPPADQTRRAKMQHLYEQVWIGELWNAGNAAGGRALARDFVDHRPIEQFPADREGHVAMALDWHRAFPDMTFKIHDVIVEGDKLVARYSAEGTHTGPLSGVAPTGRRVSLTGIDIFRIRDERLAEWWHNEDIFSLMKQICG
jgi:S-adenosylmethionine decarboxylase proenzyme